MKTGISLPDKVFEEAERYAEQHGMSRSELYRRAIEKYLSDERDRRITEQANRFFEVQGSPSKDELNEKWRSVKAMWDETMGNDDW